MANEIDQRFLCDLERSTKMIIKNEIFDHVILRRDGVTASPKDERSTNTNTQTPKILWPSKSSRRNHIKQLEISPRNVRKTWSKWWSKKLLYIMYTCALFVVKIYVSLSLFFRICLFVQYRRLYIVVAPVVLFKSMSTADFSRVGYDAEEVIPHGPSV